MRSDPEVGDVVKRSKVFIAHNANFEINVFRGARLQGKPSPLHNPVIIDQWRDSAALSRRAGGPSKLELAATHFNLSERKDARGAALIRLLSIPQKKTGKLVNPADYPEKFAELVNYCVQDVRVEVALHERLKPFDFTGALLDAYLMWQRINYRGLPVNMRAVKNAQKIIKTVLGESHAEFRSLTNYNPTQRDRVLEWFNGQGLKIENLQSDTVESALKTEGLTATVKRALVLYQNLSYAAVKKVNAMAAMACADGRVRASFVFYGTGPGRAAASGIQPQNFKKPAPHLRKFTDRAYALICKGVDVDGLEALYGPSLDVLSSCIRHFIGHPERRMVDADFSSAQAKIICWSAKQEDALERYRKKEDSYKWMASRVFNKPVSAVTKDEREVGKRLILGCGFGMGAPKFKSSCEDQYGLVLPLELCERGVKAYREAHPKVCDYWKYLDSSARSAIENPNTRFGSFIVRQVAGMKYLLAQLPSGRSIAYPQPLIEPSEEWGTNITYFGQDPYSTQWTRIKIYGGKFAENITMGIEADLMAHGCLNAERKGYEPVAIIHDQALSLFSEGHTPEEYAAALTELPTWAAGLPLTAEGHIVPYYRKD